MVGDYAGLQLLPFHEHWRRVHARKEMLEREGGGGPLLSNTFFIFELSNSRQIPIFHTIVRHIL